MVPVIRGVEGMNFADIEKTINELGEKVFPLLSLKFNTFHVMTKDISHHFYTSSEFLYH